MWGGPRPRSVAWAWNPPWVYRTLALTSPEAVSLPLNSWGPSATSSPSLRLPALPPPVSSFFEVTGLGICL